MANLVTAAKMPKKALNILVSGSGIAGSVFAYWILRAYPTARITIVERDPSLRLTGASVDIRSSAVSIIKKMNMESVIRAQTTKEEGISFLNSTGTSIAGTIHATGRSDIQTITSEFEIFRGELAKIFLDAVVKKENGSEKGRVSMIFDDVVEKYVEFDGDEKEDGVEGGVEVTFKRSGQTKTYDLLVAADGFSSKIRGMLFNTPSSAQMHDTGNDVAYFTLKKDLLNGSRLAKWYTAPGGRVIFLRPDTHPEGRTRAMFMRVTTPGDVETKERLRKAMREGNESFMALMEEMFSDAGWLAKEVLEGMRESDDFYCSPFAQIRAPALMSPKGRVVLLGDAAYATPGFGTSLAIIGGYVLAGELMDKRGDVRAAVKGYEDVLFPFAKSQQGGDRAMQFVNPQSSWGLEVRNAILGVVTGLRLDKLAIMAMAAVGVKEKMASMPEYKWPEEVE